MHQEGRAELRPSVQTDVDTESRPLRGTVTTLERVALYGRWKPHFFEVWDGRLKFG